MTGLLILSALAYVLPDARVRAETGQQANSGQAAVEAFEFSNTSPAFQPGQGPQILLHRAVSPFLQRGSFGPFMNVAASDGFIVNYLDGPVTAEALSRTAIFVIANAYTENYAQFSTLDAPSVYTADEIDLIANWVKEGGALLLIADHSPFAGGTIALASAFGFTYVTGHAINKTSLSSKIRAHIDFTRKNGLLGDHPITNGQTGRAAISHFYAFGGQAVIPPPEAENLLVIPDHFEALLGFVAAEEFYSAARMDVGGFSQGAAIKFGKGRLVVMGEAGGFTAQRLSEDYSNGFVHPEADENIEFVLATLRWLARFEPGK